MKTLKSKVHHQRKPRRIRAAAGTEHDIIDLRDPDSIDMEMRMLLLDRSPKQENL